MSSIDRFEKKEPKKKNKINVRFDHHIYNPPNWKQYDMRVRPSLWYNGYDGIKMGAVLSGDYLTIKHNFDWDLIVPL